LLAPDFNRPSPNQPTMKKVYYKGKPYRAKVLRATAGERQFSLYNQDGLLMHFVAESQLDKKSILGNIFQAYYRSIMEEQPSFF
jgi:hypothetical protein